MFKPSQVELEAFFKELGLKSKDSVLIHSDYSSLGLIQGGPLTFIKALQNVIGNEGNIIFPTFSFSFCKKEVFNPKNTKTSTGIIPNFALQLPDSHRSIQPIHSFCALGPQKEKIISFSKKTSFGVGSAFYSMLEADVKVLLLGVFTNSFVHFVEQKVGVPYRYEKTFNGTIQLEDHSYEDAFDFYVRKEGALGTEEEDRKEARELFFASPLCKELKFGYGLHRMFRAQDYCEFTESRLRADPFFLVDKQKYKI